MPPPVAAIPAGDAAVVESIGAYLHTFSLNEQDLTAGLTIPFGVDYPSGPGSSTVVPSGMARVTGETGPQGHQVYDVTDPLTCVHNQCTSHLVEIAPE